MIVENEMENKVVEKNAEQTAGKSFYAIGYFCKSQNTLPRILPIALDLSFRRLNSRTPENRPRLVSTFFRTKWKNLTKKGRHARNVCKQYGEEREM